MSRTFSPRTRSEGDRCELILSAVACAERVLPVFEGERPENERPRAALEAARAFARAEIRIGAARKLAAAARYALKVVDLAQPDGAASAVALEDDWQRRHVPAPFLDFVYPDGKP